MKKLKHHDWRKIIEGHDPSAETVAQYCRRLGVATSGFYANKRKSKKPKDGPESLANSFIPVVIDSKGSRFIKIHSAESGITIEVPI